MLCVQLECTCEEFPLLSSPVLLLGVLISNKRYHCSKFLNVLLIVAGVAFFMYTEVRVRWRGGEEGCGGRGRGKGEGSLA